MPLCDLYILALRPSTSVPAFLQSLKEKDVRPIIQAKVVRWVILPTRLSTEPLLAHNIHWDLLIILPVDQKFSPDVQSQIAAQWTVTAGVPSRLLKDFEDKNDKLLNPPPGTVKPPDRTGNLKAESSQSLELSPELSSWISHLPQPTRTHPISMLNLLAFNPNRKADYLKYGQAFAERIGSRHGGDAKIVGNVVSGQGKEEGWDEIAVAHYPSLEHFGAMLGSLDYQEVNKRHRVGSLKDTFILCTMEIDDDGELAGGKSSESKL